MSTSTWATATHMLQTLHPTVKHRQRLRTRTLMPKRTGKSDFISIAHHNTFCACMLVSVHFLSFRRCGAMNKSAVVHCFKTTTRLGAALKRSA